MSKIRCYVSHSIRGKYGVNATKEQMEANNQKAMEFAKKLRREFPSVDFYIPGEHDLFVLKAYIKKYITEEQILDIDCGIIDDCNFVLMYAPNYFYSRGMVVEKNHALDTQKHIIVNPTEDLDERTVKNINSFLESLMR